MYIENIKSPQDLKCLSCEELGILASEVREVLLKKLSDKGGHIGPNLGMVEATIALHYVFNSPKDKIVYDVSHQSYVHKMLTGRIDGFMDPECYDVVSGYSNPKESEHDFFTIGHTSTSVSLACGLAKGRDLLGGTENIIAVIGDGSLSGGEALEGLSNVGELGSNMIIVVNDNDMSIAENHGGLYGNLKMMRETKGEAECNLFRAMGLDYIYVDEGNSVQALIEAFRKVKDTEHPVVVHIVTQKGKGFKPAETNKEQWHYGMPFDKETGEPKVRNSVENYGTLTARFLLDQMKTNPELVVVTAGTPTVMGFTKEYRELAGKQFVDVGIAEEHAVAFASGIAARGGKPVWGVYSTFVQRTYDQLSQDLCINRNAAVIPVFWGSVYGMNDVTHLGFFDIPLISNIPNMVYLAPTCKEEYFAMMSWAIRQKEHPVAIRVPGLQVESRSSELFDTDYDNLNTFKLSRTGKNIAVIAVGNFYGLGESVCDRLLAEHGISATLINPRYLTGLDMEMLDRLKEDHSVVVTLEDGVLDGGFGEKISRYYGRFDMRVLNFGLRKEFVDRYVASDLMISNHLTDVQIVQDVMDIYK